MLSTYWNFLYKQVLDERSLKILIFLASGLSKITSLFLALGKPIVEIATIAARFSRTLIIRKTLA